MTVEREVTTPEALIEDKRTEPALRPHRLTEFVGQDKVREALKIAIEAGEQDSGFSFESAIKGGAIPKEFIKAVEQG